MLTAAEVVAWDHNRQGEAEFWPAGDVSEVALLFKQRKTVTAGELVDLDRVLAELGGDSQHNYLQIYYAVNIFGDALATLSAESLEDHCLHTFFGSNFLDVRREAAHELFEIYHPEEYGVWEKSHCDGLILDTDQFLDSPVFSVEEVKLGEGVALLIVPQ